MFNFINKLEEGIFSLLLVLMVALVGTEVFYRFVLSQGINWAQEATLYLSGWFVLFGVSWGIKHGVHIGVDVLINKFSRSTRRVISLIVLVLCLTYCGLLLFGSYNYLQLTHMLGLELQDIAIPKWQATLILPIGLILMIVRFLELGWKIIKDDADGFSFIDESKESMKLADHKEDKG